MKKDKKEVKKAPATEPVKEKKEISDKELDKASGGGKVKPRC